MSTLQIPPARLSFLGIVAGTRSLTLAEKRLMVALGTKWLKSGSVPASNPLRACVMGAQELLHARLEMRALRRAAWRESPWTIPGIGSFWVERCSYCGPTLRRSCEECGALYCEECCTANGAGNGVCSVACRNSVQAEKDFARVETRELNGKIRFERERDLS